MLQNLPSKEERKVKRALLQKLPPEEFKAKRAMLRRALKDLMKVFRDYGLTNKF